MEANLLRSGYQTYRRLRTKELHTEEAPSYIQLPYEVDYANTIHTR